jgi:mRNA interferase MazF
MVIHRFDVLLTRLDPTVGREMQKTRPALVVSPDEMNSHLNTVIIAPMTTKGMRYPTRIPCRFKGKSGMIALDQMRTVDSSRFVRRLGRIDDATARDVLQVLQELFAP